MKHPDLYETVRDYGKTAVPMHMPGHKRSVALLGRDLPYDGDITEIDGFDDLHDPEEGGILARLSERAAQLYRAKRAFPLVSGSTGGILAAVRALIRGTDANGAVLVARNCHKSVYHALELCGVPQVSLLPPIDEETGICGSIPPAAVAEALNAHPEVRTVVITSPTYEGVISDVRAIAETVHAHGATLLVDAAHGAHLPFTAHPETFPTAADIAVTSLHKTLPALTQTALALVYSEDEHLAARLAREITVFETSSPSYVLLASIDRCFSLLERDSEGLFRAYETRLDGFYRVAASLSTLSVLTGDRPVFHAFDRGKVTVLSRASSMRGPALADLLRKVHSIEPEMAYADSVLCMTSVCDSDENFARLLAALSAIDADLSPVHPARTVPFLPKTLPERILTLREAQSLPPAPLTAGAVSRVYAWVYPPGIPLILPGERVTEDLLDLLGHLKSSGLRIRIGS